MSESKNLLSSARKNSDLSVLDVYPNNNDSLASERAKS